MRLTISHTTHYRYDSPVDYTLQQLRLTPGTNDAQTVLHWDIAITGGTREAELQDHFDNHVTLVSGDPGSHEITIACTGEVETTDTSGVMGLHGGYVPLWYYQTVTPLTRPGPNLRKLVSTLGNEDDTALNRLHVLSNLIIDAMPYQTDATHAETTAEDALASGAGVCQDHAHVFIAAARHLGVPARYVSGYLMMNHGVEQDATHGWAEAHLDGLGWVGFDVSNRISPDERYVRLAVGLDYKDAAPVSGMTFGEGTESMAVSVAVQQ